MDSDDLYDPSSHYSPNIMDDFPYNSQPSSSSYDAGVYEPDTCRICRSEGTVDDPLYYPCKCSGSIRYVHQSCLMEWLSHSQKKHCELCKTPFQFTRIYDPQMPAELPLLVFCRKLVSHVYKNVLFWLRCVLVASIWLGWLPFMMRVFWKGLFWLADGRWPIDLGGGSGAGNNSSATATDGNATIGESSINNNSLQNSTAVAQNMTPAATVMTMSASPSPSSSLFSFAVGDMLPLFVKRVFLNAAKRRTDAAAPYANRSSWLSDITIFQSLTPYPSLNNIIIDVIEGQIITLAVVISFVLLFLIREWVVQRQPIIGLEDLQVNARDVPPPPAAQQQQQQQQQHAQHGEGHEEEQEHDEVAARENVMFLRDVLPHDNHRDDEDNVEGRAVAAADRQDPINEIVDAPAGGEVRIFQDVWTRSHGDPEEILRIVRDEDIQQLDWVVPVMENMIEAERHPDDDDGEEEQEAEGNENRAPQPEPVIEGEEEEEEEQEEEEEEEGQGLQGSGLEDAQTTEAVFSENEPSHILGLRESLASAPERPYSSSSSYISCNGSAEGSQSGQGRAVPGESAERGLANEPEDHEEDDYLHEHDNPPPAEEMEPSGHEEADPESIQEVHEENREPKSWYERLLDFFWGDIPPANPLVQRPPSQQARDEEHDHEDEEEDDDHEVAEEVAEDDNDLHAENDPLDIDAIDDADDLEGILELIGVHGPLMNLFQNALFSTLLVSFTVATAIWLPYLWGKIGLVLLTNPVRLFIGMPIALLSIVADIVVDTCIGSFGYVFYFAALVLRVFLQPMSKILPSSFLSWYSGVDAKDPLSSVSLSLVNGSGLRLKRLMDALISFNDADLPVFSMLAHKALLTHQDRIKSAAQFVASGSKLLFYEIPRSLLDEATRQEIRESVSTIDFTYMVNRFIDIVYNSWESLVFIFRKGKWPSFKASEFGARTIVLDYSLAQWGTRDRVIAVLVGYAFLALLCMLYLHSRSLFHSPDTDPPESTVSEALRQAGGVLKVIFIVGIEMLVFPLYCGLLLDVALLPLFENVTLASRIAFTVESPATSIFVHWFVGTCYMFHFALFVSMCRKLMRTGVLYFIRDPDDPTFHPVRDVLERSISTQLRKIGFSALIYGGLIMVCCGGVVWSMDYLTASVLPLRWTSHHPMLEVPVDLLFYNFIMPIATKQLKVSDWMYSMYGWWFRKCARLLRLSQFLLGKRRKDEEGRFVYKPWRHTIFEEESESSSDQPTAATSAESSSSSQQTVEGSNIPAHATFVRDGRYVRAPASDQVRIPKEFSVFLEVTEDGKRLDGKPDRDEGIHGRKSKNFTQVYVPPHFKARIMTFVFLIWVFVAVTGLGCTIGPLLIGRWAISWLVPSEIQVNDIYAFSTGVYIVGLLLYIGYHTYMVVEKRKRSGRRSKQSMMAYLRDSIATFLGSIYLISAFVCVLPFLFAMMMELYVLIPLHTTIAPDQEHVIYSVQDWALGVLYLRMAICFIQGRSRTPPAQALRAIVRNGWLSPDVRLATRGFILPATMISVTSILAPIVIGIVLNATVFRSWTGAGQTMVYRAAYPVTLGIVVAIYSMVLLGRKIKTLRTDLRDDVYLIGERLHNFGERPAQEMGASRLMMGI